MVERKILPERHRGQSWRRMLLNADGWERGKDTMLVDGLETGAVKAMSSEARERLHPQSRHTGAQSPCAATWLLDSYRILREPINGCKQASASPRGQCSARVARQTPRKHRQSTGRSQGGVREAPLTSVKHQDVYWHAVGPDGCRPACYPRNFPSFQVVRCGPPRLQRRRANTRTSSPRIFNCA
jgi:hypothetical protein